MVFRIKKQDKSAEAPGKTGENIPWTAVLLTRLKDWQAWLNVVLVFVMLEIAVFSVEGAEWITPQPSLTLALALSVIGVWILSGTRLPWVISHIIMIAAGTVVTAWQLSGLLPYPDWTTRISQLIPALQSLLSSGIVVSNDNLLFAAFLSLITWLIGYISTWFMMRRQNPWIAVALGGFMLLVNLSNLPDNRFWMFGLYFLAAVFLAAHARISRLAPSAGRGQRGWVYLVAIVLVLVILAGSIAWLVPELRAPGLQSAIAKSMLWKHNIEASKLNVFNTIPSKQPITTSGAGRSLTFEEEWHLGDEIEFIVRAERPSYWRVRVYDTYTAGGWVNSPATDFLLEEEQVWGSLEAVKSPAAMTYTVETNVKTDILLTSGSFISSDSPSLVQVGAGEVLSVRAPRIFGAGEQYTVTSLSYSPPGERLADVRAGYPEEIGDQYLDLPRDFPSEIRRLTRNVTRGADTPYEKVMAVDDYLASFSYSEKVGAPPPNRDSLVHFLFDDKSGFCLYFASAMAVMLRTVDVPSRLAVGYLPGEPGEQPGEYVLRDKHYHAWPQAYFAGYGWVDLEATPGGAASLVTVGAPIVSSDVIADLPQWDVWNPMEIYPLVFNPNLELIEPTEPAYTFGPVSFADELGRALAIILGGILALLLLFTPVAALRSSFQRWIWHVNRAELAQTAYQKMCSLAAMVKLGPLPQQTPQEYAAYLTGVFPGEAKALDHIARTYVETRFGRRGKLGLFEEAELLKARCSVYDALLARLGLAGKISAKRR